MSSPLQHSLASISGIACVIVGIAAAIFTLVKLSKPSKLHGIPTVGSNSWLGSWWAGLKYLTNAPYILQKGYEKYKPAPFKVAELNRWTVVLSSRKHVEEIRRTPDDTLSFAEAVNELLHIEYTMGPEIHHNPYHLSIVGIQLTRNIGTLYPEIRDEIVAAFDDVLDLRDNEWKSVPAFGSMEEIICRTSNRVYVGLPLCRDPDWIDLNIRYSLDVGKGIAIVGLFPDLLKPMATRFLTNINQSNQRGMKLLGPIIEERKRSLDEYGNDWVDKPNDFLSWLMDKADGPELTIKSLTARILGVNFASIHTSSSSFTHTLFFLAANPQYIRPLREEVEEIVEKEGWSKAALGKMRKVDSFLKECHRLEGVNSTSLMRKALKDFTFSDGTFIPKGTMMVTAAQAMHHDEEFYECAHAFEPFRFADLQEENDEGVKHQLASTTSEYLTFGLGRRACPGRFFAACEMVSMLAHIVVTYDVKFADNTTYPRTMPLTTFLRPDPSAKVMFRRRVDRTIS